LAKSTTEIFNNKVNLIYEYDKRSPLFVRTANTEIEQNNVEKAIDILNSGIEQFPQYSTAYLILSKAYTLVGNYPMALKNIKKGSDLIHSKKTYDYYLKELENIKKQRSLFENNSRNIFMVDSDINIPNEPDFFLSEKKESEKKSISVDDRLGQIAREISAAKIPELNNADTSANNLLTKISSQSMIVSETLAKIYVAQGEFKEAIGVYKKLVLKEPDKKEYFLQKINELKSELES
jgi:tetratricopeptide (TPR) repeat protein